MATKRQLYSEIEMVNTLKLITQAYQEISVMRMKKMRAWVLAARNFLAQLSEVFYDVKSSYKHEIEMALAKKKQKTALVSAGSKELSVFISANSKLYGDIIDRVFSSFYKYVSHADTDILIIGKLGKTLYSQSALNRKFLYFEIPDTQVTIADLRPIIFHLVKYNSINVFYGQFESVLTQNPSVSNITGDQPFKIEEKSDMGRQKETYVKFLFEPNLEQILEFFQTQVFTSLFKQTVHEAYLANFASRIGAMEESINNIEALQVKLNASKRRMRQAEENKKILERISGISLWSAN